MASSPSMDIDVVVDLHTSATAAAQTILNENSSNASSDAGLNVKFPTSYTSSSDTDDDYILQRSRDASGSVAAGSSVVVAAAATSASIDAVRSSSPPPNCAICLGRCKNKCYTDSCVHQFCFKCLCEWSKVKAECPLCKQAFRSIIHNVKANNQYEEYFVQQPVVQIPHSPLEVTYQNRGFIVNSTRGFYNFSMRSWPHANHQGIMGSRSGPISIRNYMTDGGLRGSSIPSASVAVNTAMENLPMNRSELLNLYRQELPDEIFSTMSVSQLWRRYIYDRKLYALPVSDITGRYRESSARFYRNNPGQRIRLIPFANRDIICLLRDTTHDVSTVLQSLNEGLEVSNILSRSFRRRLQPYLGERTVHFIHELSNFARSPYDMVGYDRTVQYAPQAVNEDHVIEFSSSSEEDTNSNSRQAENTSTGNMTSSEASAIRRAARRNAQAVNSTSRNRNAGTSEFRVQSRSSSQANMHSPMSLLSFTITTTSEGSEAPGVSVAVSAGSRGHAQVAAINLSTHNRAHNEVVIDLDDTVELNGSSGGDAVNAISHSSSNANNPVSHSEVAVNSTTMPEIHGSPQIVASIALSTSSSDECEFVLERKPPHLRTPEMVSLNSESDSDVVFVDETKPILAEATYSTSENEGQPSIANLLAEQEDVQQPSTSTGLRPRTVRQIVVSKKTTSTQRRDNSPNIKRQMRTRRMHTPLDHCTDESTSDDDTDDSEYIGKKRSRGRAMGRKRGNRSRKSNSSRRSKKKRSRTVNRKDEPQEGQEMDQNSNMNITDDPKAKKRRVTSKRDSAGSKIKNYSSSFKHSSSSEDESSTEEDDKMNLKALQLRLKKSLSDVEDMKTEDFNYSCIYSSPQNFDEMSRESDMNTANSTNRMNKDAKNNYSNFNNRTNINANNDADSQSTRNSPGYVNTHLLQNTDGNIDRKLIGGTTPPFSPQRPTTSAAAALAAAAAAACQAVASIYNSGECERRLSFEASNESTLEPTQEQREEGTQTPSLICSMSPASLSSTSTKSYDRKAHPIDLAYASKSRSSMGSNSSMDSFQLPSTSQQKVHAFSIGKLKEPKSNVNFNDSDSSNSSSSSSSSSSTVWSEGDRDSDEQHLV